MLAPLLLLAQAVTLELPEADPDELALALEGCRQVLQEGCTTEAAKWRARVTWSDDGKRFAVIDLSWTGEEEGKRRRAVRRVEFRPQDPMDQRYRAVGLVIAALVVASADPAAEDTSSAKGAAPSKDTAARDNTVVPDGPAAGRALDGQEEEPPAATGERGNDATAGAAASEAPAGSQWAEREATPGWGVDWGAMIGGGFSGGDVPAGVLVRPWWRPMAGSWLAVSQVRWSRSGGLARADWLEVGAGLSNRWSPSSWKVGLEARAEFAVQWVSLEAAGEAEAERRSTWRWGGRVGVEVVVPIASGWTLFAGPEVSFFSPRLRVDVAGAELGVTRDVAAAGLAGVRTSFGP